MRADEKMSRARAGLILSAPFFATLAMGLRLEAAEDCETMETDGESLRYSPAFVDSLPSAQLKGVLAHEVMHIAMFHHTRRGGRDPALWNKATDHAVNLELMKHGFELPPDRLADRRFEGMAADAIYSALRGEEQPEPEGQPQQQPGDGGQGQQGQGQPDPQGQPSPGQGQPDPNAQPQQGQGQGQPTPDPGKCGAVKDAAPGHDAAATKAAEQAAKVKVLQAAAAAKQAGNCPDFAAAMVEAIRQPEIDWRAVLRRFVDESARTDFSWTRPNRRMISRGLHLPGTVPDGLNTLGVVIDVSGSIDMDALARFLEELQGAVDDAGPDSVVVAQWNTKRVLVEEFQPGDVIRPSLKTGGGTDLRGCFEPMPPACSAVLVFTDMQLPPSRLPEDPGAPVLWIKWGDGGLGAVPYGELIAL